MSPMTRVRPLSVLVGDRVVRAVGTQFNVEIKADQRVEVIVTEGKVLIAVNKVKRPESGIAVLAGSEIPVQAGQRALLGQLEQVTEPIDYDEIDVNLSWREGNIIFRGQPLSEALKEIERYTPIEFVITDDKLKTIRVAGMFKAGDVEGLLETLQQNFNISYEREGAEKIVLTSQ
jgi:transmembrane sensor